ncbi:efflux RND transporter periplasmic adaptor subunit [Thermocrinis minervae]|uniref:Membrane fusion protein, multidrug efflux system n=1 Tax=Thermocrinis minervae TaxID=381751 RepID=A0A1M6TIB1_9AQUI|nr:efflux RND transporter periplasmic adaptor subunit [Thermocrinis minervae]SHK56623.1 membrane fusion protein, multidrug efflux system [Thermocrinis minervae]
MWIYLFLIVVLLLGSCQKKEEVKQVKKAVTVSVYTVRSEPVEVSYQQKAYLEAVKDVYVKPEVSGRILKLYVDEGSFVKAGQPLLAIDPSDYQNTLSQLNAQLSQAMANYQNQKAIVERRKFLYDKELISKEDYENALTQLKVYEDTIKSIRAQLNNAKLMLSRTQVKAPFSGFIAQRLVNVGDYVTPASQTFRLVTLNPIRIVFQVPQEIYPYVKEGSVVEVDVEGIGKYKAKVYFVSPAADQSRQLTVKAQMENPEGKLKPGMYAQVQIPLEQRIAFKVPEKSLVLFGNRYILWKVENSKAKMVPVTRIVKQEEGYAYVEAPLKDSDSIVTDNAYMLQEGVQVEVR